LKFHEEVRWRETQFESGASRRRYARLSGACNQVVRPPSPAPAVARNSEASGGVALGGEDVIGWFAHVTRAGASAR